MKNRYTFLGQVLILLSATSFVNAQDGTLDQSFGILGIGCQYDFQDDGYRATCPNSNNDSYVVGFTIGSTAKGIIHKYNANGVLESSFGNNGIVVYPTGGSYFTDALLVADGSLLVLGAVQQNRLLAKYTSQGQLDITFGQGGSTLIPATAFTEFKGGFFDNSGKIIAYGCEGDIALNTSRPLLSRFNSDGTPDANFGSAGTFILQDLNACAIKVLQTADNGYIVAGFIVTETAGYDSFVFKVDANGNLDTGFDGDGILLLNNSTETEKVFSAELTPDGKILLAYNYNSEINLIKTTRVVRYNPDGSIDNTYGQNGTFEFVTALRNQDMDRTLLQQDGKLYFCGRADGLFNGSASGKKNLMVRVNADGTLDQSFGNSGTFEYSEYPNQGSFETLIDMQIRNDNKIVVVGVRSPNTNGTFADGVIMLLNNTLDVTGNIAIKNSNEITVYPNPGSAQFYVRGENLIGKSIHVFTPEGKEVFNSIMNSKTLHFQIDKPGFYYVVANGKSQKLVVY